MISFDKRKESFEKHRVNNEAKFDKEDPSILVFELPSSTTIDDLNVLFSDFGTIKKINIYWIPKLKKTINAKIFYEKKENCEAAFSQLNEAELDGNILRIKVN